MFLSMLLTSFLFLLLLLRPDLATKKRRGGRRIRRLKEVSNYFSFCGLFVAQSQFFLFSAKHSVLKRQR